VIDAMDLLYSGRFDGFCIVSSDSDFTRLASRLRESGLTVYGFGEHKTPKPFVAACDRFIYIENLRSHEQAAANGIADAAAVADGAEGAVVAGEQAAQARRGPATAAQLRSDTLLVHLLRDAVESASDEDGWSPLSSIGNIITNRRPDFDSRTYGYGKLSDLIKATGLFVIERRSPGDGKQAVVYAREKRRQPAAKPAAKPAAGKAASRRTEPAAQ